MFNSREVESTPTQVKWSTVVAAICFAVAWGLGVQELLAQNVFSPTADNAVTAIGLHKSGDRVLIGGYFKQVGREKRTGIACLETDGTVTDWFNANVDGNVNSMALQSDGKILLGGGFTALGTQARNGIARLNQNGTLDTAFNPNPNADGKNAVVFSMALQPDGNILIGGTFTAIGGQARNRLARLNADGTLDKAFNPGANEGVRSIAVQSDGKILVGGDFTAIGGQARNRLARLNKDGTLDTAFNPDANFGVWSMALQSDGKILVGGGFTSIGGQVRNRITRLNADGTVDAAFNPNANESVYSIAIQSDGKILVGGAFRSIGGQGRNPGQSSVGWAVQLLHELSVGEGPFW